MTSLQTPFSLWGWNGGILNISSHFTTREHTSTPLVKITCSLSQHKKTECNKTWAYGRACLLHKNELQSLQCRELGCVFYKNIETWTRTRNELTIAGFLNSPRGPTYSQTLKYRRGLREGNGIWCFNIYMYGETYIIIVYAYMRHICIIALTYGETCIII